jgi:hypothetical protein
MARSAAPYVHPQLAAVKHGGDGNLKAEYTVITWRTAPPVIDGDDRDTVLPANSVPALPRPDAALGCIGVPSPSGEDDGDD